MFRNDTLLGERDQCQERTAPPEGVIPCLRHQVWVSRKVDDSEHIVTAKPMKADGHASRDIAKYLGVSCATLYRYLDKSGAAYSLAP